MTVAKNPWNKLSNVDINGEQAILATEDVELIKKFTSTKHYKNLKDDDIYRLQLGFYPQQFVGIFKMLISLFYLKILATPLNLKHFMITIKTTKRLF